MGLKFYDIENSYTDYLRKFEGKIPYIKYDAKDKFICGIVLNINECNYYAPISSIAVKQFTSMPIYHNGRIISSIRFSYMFPCPDNVLFEKDFSLEVDLKYRDLLINEWNYCNSKFNNIKEKALYIYKRYKGGHDSLLLRHCCNFPLLEQKMNKYIET